MPRPKLVYGCLPADDQQGAGVWPKSENLVSGADGEISRDRLRELSGGKVLEHAKLIEAKPNPKRRERFRRDLDEQGFLLGYERDAADEVTDGLDASLGMMPRESSHLRKAVLSVKLSDSTEPSMDVLTNPPTVILKFHELQGTPALPSRLHADAAVP